MSRVGLFFGILLAMSLPLVEFAWSVDPLSTGGTEAGARQIFKLIFYLFLGSLAALIILVSRPRVFLKTSFSVGESALLVVLFLGLLVSMRSPVPLLSAAVALSMFCLAVFVWVASRIVQIDLIRWSLIGLTFTVVVSLAAYISSPIHFSTGLTALGLPRARGIVGHPNGLGKASAALLVLAMLSFWQGREGLISRRSLKILLACAAIAGVLLSESRTAFLMVILCLLFLFMLSRSLNDQTRGKRSEPLHGPVAAVGLAAVLFWLLASNEIIAALTDLATDVSRSGNPDEIYTFTGRLDVWAVAAIVAMQHPVFGMGWRSGEVLLPAAWNAAGYPPGWFPIHAHNMFLETWLGVGAVGVLAIVVALLATARYNLELLHFAVRRGNMEGAVRAVARLLLLTLVVSVGLTERSAMGNTTIFFVLLVVVVVDSSADYRIFRSSVVKA